MIKLKGNYPLDGIKYFYPEVDIFEFSCPFCNHTVRSGVELEYPKEEDYTTTYCDECDCEIKIPLRVKLVAHIEVITQEIVAQPPYQ